PEPDEAGAAPSEEVGAELFQGKRSEQRAASTAPTASRRAQMVGRLQRQQRNAFVQCQARLATPISATAGTYTPSSRWRELSRSPSEARTWSSLVASRAFR